MYKFPIGAMVESFRLDTKSAILKAAEIGAKGLQMYSTMGENAPENAFAETESGIKVAVSEAAGHKCDRCWFVSEDAQDIGEGQHLCPRCAAVTGANA